MADHSRSKSGSPDQPFTDPQNEGTQQFLSAVLEAN
jgi:hypothetical protein